MKTKEQLANEYALENFKEFGGSGSLEIANKSFLAGYEAAQPKWVKVEDELPPVKKHVIAKNEREFIFAAELDNYGNCVICNTGYKMSVSHWCDCIPTFKSETE